MQFRNWFAWVLLYAVFCWCDAEQCNNIDEDGTCLDRCPENTFVYIPGCDNETISQRTCRFPLPRSMGFICDYTRCECHQPQVWDEAVHKCVMIKDCSDQSKVIEEEEKLKKEHESISYRPFVDTDFGE